MAIDLLRLDGQSLLDVPLLDHLVIGEGDRYFSFREAGLIDACTSWARMP